MYKINLIDTFFELFELLKNRLIHNVNIDNVFWALCREEFASQMCIISVSKFFNIHNTQAKTFVDVIAFNLGLRQLVLFVCLYQEAEVFLIPINEDAEIAFTLSSVFISGAANKFTYVK